ncbi:4-hydroxybenzoate octaprenyltransferase [Ferrovum sp.]|uniref:4-hydroxybenzoate octaprenyltransferase n=1 Tax=Ferrovum sp. TaxID=2609467 RepID=UPI0026355DF3|nr:4-hydroxybenzoate octaprenyltransferase [Ferrovum sp.]
MNWNAWWRLTRMDKPIGTLLLLWPTLWALWLASQGHPSLSNLLVFSLGTLLMRSAGCVMNDIADRKVDPHVARTRLRPLASGEVSVKEALVLALLLSLCAFALVLTRNTLTLLLSLPALFLAASYPLTKRFFPLPQAYLGIAFGFGIPMAFAAELGRVPGSAWILLLANTCWTLAYDTEYAMVDREDDRPLGIHSTALLFGNRDVILIMMFYGLCLLLLGWTGWHFHLGVFFYGGLCGAAGVASFHYTLIRTRARAQCLRAFLHNTWFGATIFGGIFLSYAMR